jgi:hypothetical protein
MALTPAARARKHVGRLVLFGKDGASGKVLVVNGHTSCGTPSDYHNMLWCATKSEAEFWLERAESRYAQKKPLGRTG